MGNDFITIVTGENRTDSTFDPGRCGQIKGTSATHTEDRRNCGWHNYSSTTPSTDWTGELPHGFIIPRLFVCLASPTLVDEGILI